MEEKQTPAKDPLRRDLVEKYLNPLSWRKDYRQWLERRINYEDYQQGILKLLRTFFKLQPEDAVLDLGCGMGGLCVALQRQNLKVSCLDFNFDYCTITRSRGKRYQLTSPVVQAIGEQLPYADASFNLVICMDVTEHANSTKLIIQEINRVLKPGGTALITATNRFGFFDPHFHLRYINWMPRCFGEYLVTRANRNKNNGPWQDCQNLSVMNYLTWRQFSNLAKNCNLAIRDLVLPEVMEQGMAKFALQILYPFYRLFDKFDKTEFLYKYFHRPLFNGTFRAKLVKSKRKI